MGGKFGRVLFMRDYASFISDEMIKDLSDFSRNLLLSIDILPIPTEEAVREVQSRILGVGNGYYALAAKAESAEQFYRDRAV